MQIFNNMKTIITPIVILATLSLSMPACSILKSGKDNSIKGSSATTIEKPVVVTGEVVGAESKEPMVGSQQGVEAPVVRQNNKAVAESLAGEWKIIKVGSTTIDRDEDMPYINFDAAKGQFYANNGCNTLNGSFTATSDNELEFYGVLSTMKYCGDVKYDTEINMIIADNKPSKFALKTKGSESFLDIYDVQGNVAMTLRRGDISFLNGHWQIKAINGLEKMEAVADVFFDLAELKLHGNTGCNYFNGDIYLDHRRSNAVDFSNMGVTRMACPHAGQESAILVALEQSASAINNGNDHVTLVDADGKALMTLERLPMDKSIEE